MRVAYGIKFVCYSCAAKFYDLGRARAVCPICGTDQAQRPRKKEKKSLQDFELQEKAAKEKELVDVEGPDDTVLMEVEATELDENIGENSSIAMEDDDEE